MNLNFHYFAVKAIARTAGFLESDAQRIAEFSQFVDDFTPFMYINVDKAVVPEWARYLLTRDGFDPVTTSISDTFDMAALIVPKYQTWMATPYHFAPAKTTKEMADGWRVVPAKIGDGSPISDMLAAARDGYMNPAADEPNDPLMRIGTLVHTFSDTYSHQRFNGFDGWQNRCELIQVIDDRTGKDITEHFISEMAAILPHIGHANALTAPDETFVRFTIKQQTDRHDTAMSDVYTRTNADEFCLCAREVMNYLRSCLNKEPISPDEWRAFEDLLRQGFRTDSKDPGKLAEHWGGVFTNITFGYDKNKVLSDMGVAASESGERLTIVNEPLAFYRFNVLADKQRTTINAEPFTPIVFA